MARPKVKETQSFTIRMDKCLFDQLTNYCEQSGQSKTIAVERALQMYIADYNKKMDILASIEAEQR